MPRTIHGLSEPEIRILGCLLEKQRTTPATYPLTLNALRLACNQSTNRDPVVEYSDELVSQALQSMHRRELTRPTGAHGSRSSKYRHLVAETLGISDAQQALLCVLLLRGDQTPGELKQRTDRLHHFEDLAAIDETLETMIELEMVERLERRPGEKQVRYRQLLGTAGGEEVEIAGMNQAATITAVLKADPEEPAPDLASEVADLKSQVEALRAEVAELRQLHR
jgi:uncharacterized protein YceH (UPF0502 family)